MKLGFKNGIHLINGTDGNHIFHHSENIFGCLLPPWFQAFLPLCIFAFVQDFMKMEDHQHVFFGICLIRDYFWCHMCLNVTIFVKYF